MQTASNVKELLSCVFDNAREDLQKELTPAEYENRKHDFVFHMSDWQDDMARMLELFKNPDQFDTESASTFVIGFLYHVVPHLNSAGRLLLDDIRDPFPK